VLRTRRVAAITCNRGSRVAPIACNRGSPEANKRRKPRVTPITCNCRAGGPDCLQSGFAGGEQAAKATVRLLLADACNPAGGPDCLQSGFAGGEQAAKATGDPDCLQSGRRRRKREVGRSACCSLALATRTTSCPGHPGAFRHERGRHAPPAPARPAGGGWPRLLVIGAPKAQAGGGTVRLLLAYARNPDNKLSGPPGTLPCEGWPRLLVIGARVAPIACNRGAEGASG